MAFAPFNALNAFLAVARRRSYAGAAKDLGVSSSALSQAVRQLEARVGVPLLNRTSRSVSLTQAGQRVLETAGPALDLALESLKVATAPDGVVSGTLRLTVPTAAINLVLNQMVPVFVERHPRVELDVMVEDQLVDAVGSGIDAGIRLVEAIDRDMVHVRLTRPTRLVVVGAPAYLEHRGVPQTPNDLLDHSCLGVRFSAKSDPWPWELERGKRTWRVPVRGPVTSNNFSFLRSLAVSGLGLFYSLEANIEAELASGALDIVLDAYAAKVPGLFLYYPSRKQASAPLRAFIEVANEVLKRKAKRT